jgi:hypothetical protein
MATPLTLGFDQATDHQEIFRPPSGLPALDQ